MALDAPQVPSIAPSSSEPDRVIHMRNDNSGSGWSMVQKLSALLTLLLMLAGLLGGVGVAYYQLQENTRAIASMRRVVGYVQWDVAAMCLKMHDNDQTKCRTATGDSTL